MMTRTARTPQIFLTIDMEQDCPPYLDTFRGITGGHVLLLSLLQEENIKCTFFVTGQVARTYPDIIRRLITQGHEVGSHGFNHSDYTTLDRAAARRDIELSLEILGEFCPVTSFRAPYLKFPPDYLDLLEKAGLLIDSSAAKYKPSYLRQSRPTTLRRIPASITSSVLRLPAWIRNRWLGSLQSPVVLFVHPWEFIDLQKENIPLDCRFKTGRAALVCLKEVIRFYKQQNFQFKKLHDILREPANISLNECPNERTEQLE